MQYKGLAMLKMLCGRIILYHLFSWVCTIQLSKGMSKLTNPLALNCTSNKTVRDNGGCKKGKERLYIKTRKLRDKSLKL